jgi:prevent-host-death family protein
MKSTVSVSEGQARFPAMVKSAEKGGVITVTRHNQPVAYVLGSDRMTAVAETLEIMANPSAMEAIREHRAGKTRFGRIRDIPS